MSNKDFEAWWNAPTTNRQLTDIPEFIAEYVWQAARAKYEPKWISVDERLPEPNREYLVNASYIDGEADPVQRVETATLTMSGDWQYQCGSMDYHYSKDDSEYRVITHWQTLPPAPQENDNG